MWTRCICAMMALCSLVAAMPQGRVVNGSNSTIEKYPFMVSLRSYDSHICGGTIIAPRWILTAAHCVVGLTPYDINIQFSSTEVEAYSPFVAKVQRIIVHEYYTPSKSYANDIALLQLSTAIHYNYKTIAPIELPDPYFEVPQTSNGARGTLTGWGYEATGGSVQKTLQEVELKVYSDYECYQRHSGATTNDHICGGVDEGGKGQCSGDSGGPLIYEGSVQLGIVSWSVKPCGIVYYPGVYTKVSHYVEWISRQMLFYNFL